MPRALGPVAEAALASGVPGCASSAWRSAVFSSRCWPRPRPASTRPWSGGEAAVERKLDGHRIQVHRDGTEVAVFTRTLDDITARVPEVVAAALTLPVGTAVLDGEVIALQPGRAAPPVPGDGQPGRQPAGRGAAGRHPASHPFLFDLLHLDGQTCSTSRGPNATPPWPRWSSPTCASRARSPPTRPRLPASWTTPWVSGHEGVVALALLAATWEAGRPWGWPSSRSSRSTPSTWPCWPPRPCRRRGWLSNLHLGARDLAGGFVMLGKTFKGLTDRLLTLAD